MREDHAWNLSTRLGEAFFRICHSVRVGVSDSFNTSDPARLADAVWFGVARTLDSMQEFDKHEFKSHPAIAGEYIKFILLNAHSDSASTFDLKFEDMDKKLKEVTKDAAGALRSATTAHSKADTAKVKANKAVPKEDFNKLVVRVKRLED